MNQLRNLQEKFQNYLLNDDKAIIADIKDAKPDLAAERLAVYADAYYLRLIEILEADYPSLAKCLTEDVFAQLARDYIAANPSANYTVHNFGENLAQFITSRTGYDPYLAELAEFEWALARVLVAKTAKHATAAELARVKADAWPELHFFLHPSLEVHRFHYNVPQIWQAMNADTKDQVIHQPEPLIWLIWRFQQTPYYATITTVEEILLDAMKAGNSFMEICEKLCQWMDAANTAQFVAEHLRLWLDDGLITKIVSPSKLRVS